MSGIVDIEVARRLSRHDRSGIRTRSRGGVAVVQRMPLARYFVYVGGVLVMLVFFLDAWLTMLPVMEASTINSPVIRINSDRKWPERIVFDTARTKIVPATTEIV